MSADVEHLAEGMPGHAGALVGDPCLSGNWRIECIKSLAEMRANAQAWLTLERDCLDPHAAFQCYDWCEGWASVFCDTGRSGAEAKSEPRIFFIYRGDALVAILPLMVTSHMGARVLTLFGEPHSQIAAVLTRDGIDCADGIRLCLAQASYLTDADVVAIGPMPSDSSLARAVNDAGLSPDPADLLSVSTWPGVWRIEDYLTNLSKNRRKDFNRKLRRLEKYGQVTFKRHDANSPDYKTLVELALKFKREWLKRNGMWSLGLSQEGVDEFLTGIVSHDGGYEVEIDELSVNGKPVAIGVNLVGCQVRSNYLSSYDHDYADCSPGTLLFQFSVQNSIEDGMNGFSFLGYPTPFKDHWANEKTPLVRYQHALTAKGKVWLSVWIGLVRPTAKRILVALRGLVKRIA